MCHELAVWPLESESGMKLLDVPACASIDAGMATLFNLL
jgi:hypothetical protein